ncbi:MAG: hypothetical protein ACHRXM_17605 [Isosphaerales bacterium]
MTEVNLMWEPEGKLINAHTLGSLEPAEVLFEYEGEPLTFVARDLCDELLLVHSLLVFDRMSRYLVSAVDQRILDHLKSGQLDVRGALRQPRCWVADMAVDGAAAKLWRVEFDSVPESVLPRAGTMLTPQLEPLLRVRLLGNRIGPGKTSATDIRMATQAGESSLKRLAEIAFKRRKRAGRPSRQLRHYFDLPVPYLGDASFEIAFGAPRSEPELFSQEAEVFDEMGKLLAAGFRLVQSDKADAAAEDLDQEDVVPLLEAIRMLTPPIQGDVDRIEIGGRMIEERHKRMTLTRDDRRKVIERIKPRRKAAPKERPFLVTGSIPEADQDAFTFTLRDLDPQDIPGVGPVEEIPFRFAEHLLDIVIDAFNSLERVTVVGEGSGTEFQALDIEFAGDPSLERSEPHPVGSE